MCKRQLLAFSYQLSVYSEDACAARGSCFPRSQKRDLGHPQLVAEEGPLDMVHPLISIVRRGRVIMCKLVTRVCAPIDTGR